MGFVFLIILRYLSYSLSPLRMDLDRLPVEMVEILNKVTPNEEETKKFSQFDKEKKSSKTLPDNDRFLYEVSQCLI